jgi:glucose-1-phosphate cytidylyltransferase
VILETADKKLHPFINKRERLNLKVIILCGGRGTRLREETEFRPKPMVPIGNRPILWHIMKTYSYYGHKDFILCLGYKGELIKDYFRNYLWHTCDISLKLGRNPSIEYHNRHTEEDWSVTLADTGEDSMTGHRIKLIEKYICKDETFLLTYGDGLSTINIDALINSHSIAGKICTISAVHPAGRFGSLRINEDGSIHTFSEKPQFEDAFVNGGYMVCNHKLFNYLTNDDKIMLERQPMENLARDGQLNSYRHEGFWQPMDTHQEAIYLNRLWAEGNAPWKIW